MILSDSREIIIIGDTRSHIIAKTATAKAPGTCRDMATDRNIMPIIRGEHMMVERGQDEQPGHLSQLLDQDQVNYIVVFLANVIKTSARVLGSCDGKYYFFLGFS